MGDQPEHRVSCLCLHQCSSGLYREKDKNPKRAWKGGSGGRGFGGAGALGGGLEYYSVTVALPLEDLLGSPIDTMSLGSKYTFLSPNVVPSVLTRFRACGQSEVPGSCNQPGLPGPSQPQPVWGRCSRKQEAPSATLGATQATRHDDPGARGHGLTASRCPGLLSWGCLAATVLGRGEGKPAEARAWPPWPLETSRRRRRRRRTEPACGVTALHGLCVETELSLSASARPGCPAVAAP